LGTFLTLSLKDMRGGGKKIKNTQEEDEKQKASWISLSLVYSSFAASVMNYPEP